MNELTNAEPTGIGELTSIALYSVYAALAVGLVVFLARILFRNGKVFLRDVFEDDDLAESVNTLLVVGFYLLNLGYALVVYRVEPVGTSLTAAVNGLFIALGTLLLSLGVLHLLNMYVFWRIRNHRSSRSARRLPPTPGWAPQPPPPTAAGS